MNQIVVMLSTSIDIGALKLKALARDIHRNTKQFSSFELITNVSLVFHLREPLTKVDTWRVKTNGRH